MKNKDLNNKIVVRFAPSPTGLFHVGSARVALFNYIFAKQHGGKFILRIEDTDKERSKKEYEEDILNGMKWLGFSYDELYRQSERGNVYKKYIEKLISEDKAYVSKEEVKEAGQRAEVIRFRNPNKKVKFNDLVRGEIEFDTTDLGDFVIAKSFDEPVFHLVVVIDDFEMGVTHIIRGEDHISNTPRHILIQEAIGAPVPIYAHLPLMLAEDRAKLSKRIHGEMTSVKFYEKMGYIPEAFVNFLSMVGWNPGGDVEIMSMSDLIEKFDIGKVQKGGAIFNQQKLLWFNKEYLKRLPEEAIEKEIINRFPENCQDKKIIKKIYSTIVERINVFSDIDKMVADGDIQYFFEQPELSKEMIIWKKGGTLEQAKENLSLVLDILKNASDKDFTLETIKEKLMSLAEEKGKGNVLWPLRVVLSGKEKSPDPFTLLSLLGKAESEKRVQNAINFI
jgi:glutamyl-tRNA synthetase